MRSLLLAASLLACAAPLTSAAAPAVAAADWRQAKLTPAMQEALRGAGYRLEDDGRVLDPMTHAALSPNQLAAALRKIALSTQRLALERLRLMLDKGPLKAEDLAAVAALKDDLPADVARALNENTGTSDLKKLADRDLAQAAAYFDGGRSRSEIRPVLAGAPGPRVPLPYFDDSEKRLGKSLREAAAARLARNPFGREVLSRLNGADQKPDLPPIVIEDLSGEGARYDYRRRTLILDRQLLMSAAADGVPAAKRGGLERSLESRAALIGWLNSHPGAVGLFAARNDALLVHELTHAWQDRREPVMREMARGNLPAAVVIDYEEEAAITKNLYLLSKLKSDASSIADDGEFADCRRMFSNPEVWRAGLRAAYEGAASNALDLSDVRAVSERRVALARARAVESPRQQAAKARALLALTRADKEVTATVSRERTRLLVLQGPIEKARAESPVLLAGYYLSAARRAANPAESAARLQKAEFYASRSGDAALIAKVKAEQGRAP